MRGTGGRAALFDTAAPVGSEPRCFQCVRARQRTQRARARGAATGEPRAAVLNRNQCYSGAKYSHTVSEIGSDQKRDASRDNFACKSATTGAREWTAARWGGSGFFKI